MVGAIILGVISLFIILGLTFWATKKPTPANGDVCPDLQEHVREAVKNMTGLQVVELSVKIEKVAIKIETIVDMHRMK